MKTKPQISTPTTPATAPEGKRGKNSKFSHELFLRVIERVREGAFVREAIVREGIGHSCFYSHLVNKPDYLDTLKGAQLCGPVNVAEAELYRRGVKGTLKPVFQGGKQVGEIREFDTTALIFYLKHAWPERYAEPSSVMVQNNVGAVPACDIRKILNEQTPAEAACLQHWAEMSQREKEKN